MNTIDNQRLQQIANAANALFPTLVSERESELLRDYSDAVNAAHDEGSDKLPKLKLTFDVSFDLAKSELDVTLKWTVSRKESASVRLEDPSQPDLPGTR
mgnify:CR=1 FL=1